MTDDQSAFLMKEAEAVFFIAMRVGYAGGLGHIRVTELPGIPGSKCITWQNAEGQWKVVDTYLVNKSLGSSGMTVIAYKEEPVWVMHYGGHYEKAAIPFLKKCLAEAYGRNEFNGGRGPEDKYGSEEGLMYTNKVKDGSTFAEFSGREWIRSRDGNRIVGRHWYHGHSMITHRDPV